MHRQKWRQSITGGSLGWDGELWLPPSIPIPMATVVSWLMTPEGFVIGSDGRKTDSEGQSASDNSQKIFPIEGKGLCLAYGLAATIRIGQAAENVLFDFKKETARTVERLALHPPKNWWEFLSAVMVELREALNRARSASNDTLAREAGTYIFMGGIYGKHFKSGHLYFRHGITTSEAEPYIHPPGSIPPPFGSPKVFEALASGDARLARYSNPPRQGIATLASAIERVQNEVLAHCDPEARNVDNAPEWPYGGRVQIASITVRDGFRWVTGFEPLTVG